MTSCELSDGRHQHHIGTFKPSVGLFDIFRSLVLSPKVIVGVPLSEEDYINLPFQPEQRLPHSPHTESKTTQFEPTSLSKEYWGDSSSPSSSCYTVKSFRRLSTERRTTGQRYSETTTSVLSFMHHVNILYAIDLEPVNLANDLRISHIHLGTVIAQAGKLSSREADCYIIQLLSGLSYLHSLNISHRDISPSNLILTTSAVLKIANFTSSEHLKPSNKFRSSRRCGTMPYIAPEVFVEKQFSGKAVDMWAVAVIYMEMRCGKVFWEMAAEGADEGYDGYLRDRIGLWGFRPVENLKNKHCRDDVRSLLDPYPGKRMTASQVLKSKWCLETELRAAANGEKAGKER
ncbi:hypothetical protein IFR05_006132 [Cadophora sp. M221]|nr:hypothetical protein IFR05_006132 [Cadophora sp. M221]